MKLEWIGHACFRLTAENGTVVITDPYDESVGIDMIPLEANLITMSHEHHDHCETSMIVGTPVIVRGHQGTTAGGVTTRAEVSYHDDVKGTKRGPNVIRFFAVDGIIVAHLGDQGCMPDEAVLNSLKTADVLLIPVGGTYTVDAQGAKAIIDRVNPRCVIPMHVKTKRCPYPIAKVDEFLRIMGVPDAKPVSVLEMTKETVPCGVVLMKPMADEL